MSPGSPIFIVSSPRSGSTLLRLILDAHPRLAVPPPAWLFDLVYPYMYSYGDLGVRENLRALAEDVLATPTVSKWPIRPDVEELVEQCAEASFAGIFAALCERYARCANKTRWGEKTPRNAYWIDEIVALFPGAQIIHILRDGRDVAVDIAESVLVPHTVYGGARLWQHYVSAVRDAATRLDTTQFLEIRYEAVCASPEAELRRLCEFLGEPFDRRMLTHDATEASRSWGASAALHAKAARPITTEFCGIHRARLPADDRAAIESLIGEMLAACDYELEGRRALVPRRLAAQLEASDSVTNIDNVGYRNWHAARRAERRRRGVWSTDALGSLLWSPE